ncbi:glycosyltransferase [Xanthobacter sp.]|uniref:glycosyltransferase n=1 Tax=Xanthobacter sp. TaxID=35809 RepID=UPI0025CCFD1E|nr:glycosyltransferase [Xanthobacter sp.]
MVGDAGAARKGRSHVNHDAGEDHRDLGRDLLRARDDGAASAPLQAPIASALPASALPASELHPYRDHVDANTLRAAAARARLVGVGVDEVLVASGALDDQTATRLLARDLGLSVAAPHLANLPDDPAMAEAVLRTGTLVIGSGGGRPRFVMAARGRIVRRLRRALKRDAGLASRVKLISPAALARRVGAVCAPSFAAAATGRLVLADPLKSASTLRPGRIVGLAAAAVGLPLALLLALAPEMGLLTVQAALSLVFLAWIALRFAGCIYVPPEEPLPVLNARSLPVYSVLVPLYDEAASVPGLVAALSALDYPSEKLDIKLVVEADDHATRAAITALELPPHMAEVVVAPVGPRTKPKALEAALPFVRGSIVAIYDAEDLPEPGQLRRVVAAFRAGGPKVGCVQARLCIDNGGDSWISAQFAAEYAGQFDVLLPALSALGLPIPLGGTSNHFRRRVLDQVGGWDPYNVTEDADLGIRLARAGWQTRVISSTTFEEAPVTRRAWIGQRTRWLKGWAQTLLVHGRRPRVLVRDLGPAGTIALMLLTAGPYAAALVHPLCLALLIADIVRGVAGLPCTHMAEVVTSALTYATLVTGYAGAAATMTVGLGRRGIRPGWRTVASIPFYWLLLSVAAWRAVIELIRRPYHWQKTEHGAARRGGGGGLRSSASAPPRPRPEGAWS